MPLSADVTKGVQRFIFILTDDYNAKATALSAYLASYLDQKRIPFSYLKLSTTLSLTFGNLSPEKEGEAFITWDGGEVDYDVGIIERSITGELPRTSCLTLGQAIQQLYIQQAKQQETGFTRLTFEDDLLDYLVTYIQMEPTLQHPPSSGMSSYEIPIRIVEIGGGVRQPSTQIFTRTIERLLSLSCSEDPPPSAPQRGSVIILMATANPDAIKPEIMQLFCGYAPDYLIQLHNLNSTDILDDEYTINATRVDAKGMSDEKIMLKELIAKWNKAWAFKAFAAKSTTELVSSMAVLPSFTDESVLTAETDMKKAVEMAKCTGQIEALGNVLVEMRVDREEVVELGDEVLREFDNALAHITEEQDHAAEGIFGAICMICGTAKKTEVCPVCTLNSHLLDVNEAITEATFTYMASPTDLCCKSISQNLTHMRLASNICEDDPSDEIISDTALYDSESDTSTAAEKSHLSSQKRYFGSKSVAKMVKNYGDAFLAEKDTNMPLGSLITATAKDLPSHQSYQSYQSGHSYCTDSCAHTPTAHSELQGPSDSTSEVPGEIFLAHSSGASASVRNKNTHVTLRLKKYHYTSNTDGHLKLRIENLKKKEAETSLQQMLASAAQAKTLRHEMTLKHLDLPCIIAIVGKFVTREDSYLSILEALRATMHKYHHDKPFAFLWVDPTALDEKNCDDILQEAHGFVLPGGFGDIGVNGLMLSIRYARTHNKPILGLCLGFQMMVCEFARDVCGLSHANSTEMDPDTPHKLIIPISEMLETGQIKPLHKQQNVANPGTTAKYSTMRLGDLLVSVKPNTMLSECYNKYPQVKERHWHSFAVNTQYIDTLTKHGLIISGMDFTNQLPMAVELPTETHPFFMATQYHPEFTSKHRLPHTLFVAFVSAIYKLQDM
ncbi:CTP synthase/UTP-ammonia lyase [Giardia lamblia P15]|uniref:CTP synthase n=1 Tax=Giardia intestinalis (strain P15) TaxID=658858 RepID=E1F0J0_GIAIA|nr:CTP synthase/UTP-ammonia lyase [Giardia lamblia P15]